MKKIDIILNKTITLIILFLLLSGFVFAQSTVTVSGAASTGSGANGTYNNAGTTNIDGTNRAYFDLPASVFRIEYRYNASIPANEWEIWEAPALGGGGTIRYYNSSSSTLVPQNGWLPDIASGNPTISYTLNQAPVLASIEGTTLAYTEGDAATVITATIAVSDADDTNIESATIQITGSYQNGQDVLSFTNQNGITGTWTAATGIMALSGSTTKANYQTALQSVKYSNSSNSPNTSTRTVSFTVNDGDDNSNTQTRNISITSVNSAPVLAAIEGTTLSYTENDAATAITSSITVSDVDDTNIESATIQITTNYQNGQDVLSFTNQNNISGTWTAATGTMALTGSATKAFYETALRDVKYNNSSDDPNTSTRTVSFTINDGDDDSDTSTRQISVSATNDAPVLAAIEGTTLAYNEGDAATAITSAITVSDADDTNIESATIQITTNYQNGQDVLSFSTQNGISGTWTAATGTMALSGSTTKANYQTALRDVKYSNSSGTPNTSTRTVSFTVNDGNDASNTSTRQLSVTEVNSAPVLAAIEGTALSYTEGEAATNITSTITVSDADDTNIEGATVQITTNYQNGQDVLSFTNQNGILGTWTAGTGTMSLSGSATKAFYQTALRDIKYNNSSEAPNTSTRTVSFTVNDGDDDSNTETRDISISATNDDPTISGLPTDITVLEDVASNVNLSAATFGDVDAGANSIKLSIKAGAGILLVAASAGLSFNGNATDSITITGTASNIDTYLNTASNILYTSASNVNGNDATILTIIANDQGYTGSGGGSDVTLGTVNVDITAVNDPPVVSNVFGDNASEVVAGSGAQNVTDLDEATVSNVDSPDYNGGFLAISQGSGTTNGSFGVDGSSATSGGDASIAAGETIAVGGTSIGTVHATNDGQGGNSLEINFNSANATSARIQTLIRSFTYSAPSGLGARTFTLTLNDNDGTTNSGDEDASGNITITVTPNPPIISNLDGDNASVPVGGAAGNIDVGGNATVTDADSPNFNGGNLTITQNTGTANGNFSVTGIGSSGVASGTSVGTANQTISGSEIIYVDGVAIASVSSSNTGQSGNNLTITLGSNATPARTQQFIRALQYAAPSGPGNRTFTLTIVDASSNSASGSANFTITVLPPEMDLKKGTTAIADGGSFNFGNKALNSNNDIVFTIHNSATGILSITTPLTLGGADAGQFSLQSQPSASVPANDSTTFTVRFTPTSTGAKAASIAITNNDTDENPYDLLLSGSGNTPPTGGNDAITIYEDETYTFAFSDFTFNDPDTDTFDGIQLQSLETAGTLTYNGVDAVTSIDYPDMTKLKFTPESNGSGSPYATFTFKVIDSNGGYSTAAYTMTINVTSLPDLPKVVTNLEGSVIEGGTFTFSDEYLKSIDNDGPSFPLKYNIIQPPLHGVLESGSLSGTITQNAIANREVRYIHDGSESVEDTFVFTVEDSDGNLSAETTFNITILGIDDPPVISTLPGIIMNEDEIYSVSTSSWFEYISDPDNPVSTLSFSISTGSNIGLNQTDEFTWEIIPAENYFGNTEISITVSDDSTSVTSIIQVTIQPVNDLPELVDLPDSLLIPFGGNTSFTVNGTDLETASNLLTFEVTFTEGITAAYNDILGTVTVTATSGFSGESLLTVSVSDTDGGTASSEIVIKVGDSPTGLERINGIPEDYTLYQNYPNPFNPSTTIRYGIPAGTESGFSSKVTLRIYDILGNEVVTLVEQNQTPGYYEYKWNASNNASGIYFYILSIDKGFREVHKMILLK